MEFIKNLKLLTIKYDRTANNLSFIKKTFEAKLKKYREVFDVELELLINNCLKILNANGKCWNVNVYVQQSYDKALGFSSTPVGEYRYENIYKIEFTAKNGSQTISIPLLSCRLNAKTKNDYVNNPFPTKIKVNLLDLYFNEKKLDKLYIPLSKENNTNNSIISHLTDVLWIMIENNSKNLILSKLLPTEIESLCSLYENNASAEEIEKCKNTIKMFHNELLSDNNKEK